MTKINRLGETCDCLDQMWKIFCKTCNADDSGDAVEKFLAARDRAHRALILLDAETERDPIRRKKEIQSDWREHVK